MDVRSRGKRPAGPDVLKQLEGELLAKFRARRQPAKLMSLFEGLSPRWAQDAADRLVARGQLEVDGDGRYAAVATGGGRAGRE